LIRADRGRKAIIADHIGGRHERHVLELHVDTGTRDRNAARVLYRAEKDCVIAFTLIVTNPPGPNRALTGKGNDRGKNYAAWAHRYRVQKGIST
jgi:hypothetical protein